MSYWVAAHITGGLGNRLFQHAAAMGLAEKWGRQVIFYLPNVEPTNHGPFDNLFKLFPNVPLVIEDQENIMLPEPAGHVFTYSAFQDTPLANNVVVDGWRQTAMYFPLRGVHVSLESAIPHERQTELREKYKVDAQTCFVHIRLGDYKILPHHQIDIGAYIAKASKEFPKKTKFLVFSDEAVQYKDMLENLIQVLGHEPTIVVETDELENLYLMSQCSGAIVGNSTFSWWGAYLARQRCSDPNRFKACYPRVWGAGLPPARDVIPSWGIPVQN